MMSLNENNKNTKEENNSDIDKVLMESLNTYNSEQDQLYLSAMLESENDYLNMDTEINNTANNEVNNGTNNAANNGANNDIKLWVCLDLRIYGPQPNKEICILDDTYYLSKEQIDKLKKLWYKIDPESSSGIINKQNRDYNKAVYDQMVKKNMLVTFQS